ncbi:S-layer homology domain-containing protein [Tumebacillus sp. ITR2]|uniref:S-layer homology domain-containing protein n=1 Tax=Tumebacillus amylolyticus TaxID=2801339 RepID=A0ABS1JG38_9BACL|nr:S-layer homology domain-containing protein [Tumebacillus amylolyticus]MBL0389223.1 S-layer homology domain-containing protein [Tumebacillus amylolyticus]
MRPKHKWLATTLALTMTITPLAASASTTTYRDLTQAGSWAQDAIQQALTLGVMSGDGDGNFRPLATITRQEAAAVLVRTLNLPTPATNTSSFQDVALGDWSHTFIEAAVHAGLMSGDGDGTFRPNDEITREEMAVLLVKASGGKVSAGDNLTVADRDSISPWAKGFVQTALETSLLHGDGTNFNPQDHASRQEVAVMSVTLANSLQKKDLSAKVDSLADGTVVLGGKTYKVAESLQGLFAVSNQNVLQGANLQAQVAGDTLTNVTSLELVAAGQPAPSGKSEFSGNLVLDGHDSTISGALLLSADYISVQNLHVTGDLSLNPALQNDFYAHNLHVAGKTKVAGGDANTVVFADSELKQVQIAKDGVHVESNGTTTLSELVVSANATISSDSTVSLPKVTVESGVTKLQLDAPVQALEVGDKATKLILGTNTKIDTLILPTGTQITDVIPNYNAQKNPIQSVLEKKADGSTAPQTPPTPIIIGGGGGGGYIPTPTPTPTPTPVPTSDLVVESVRALNTTTVEITFNKKPAKDWSEGLEFTGGLKWNFEFTGEGALPEPNKILIQTDPQQNASYEVLLNGAHTGKTFQGAAPQLIGHITLSDGSPVGAGKKVILYHLVAQDYPREISFTDANGDYAVSGLVDGGMYVLYLDIDTESTEIPPHEVDFFYHTGDPLPKLSYAAPQVVGRLTMPDGSPVRGHSISLFSSDQAFQTQTDSNGYYRFAYLTQSQTYTIEVDAYDDPSTRPYVAPPATDFTYTGTPVSIPTLSMQVPNLTGSILDVNGTPLESAVVFLRTQSGDIRARYLALSGGTYKLFVPDGAYTLDVGTPNGLYGDPQSVEIQVQDGVVTPAASLDIHVPNLELQGTIHESAGFFTSAYQIQLLDQNGLVVYNGWTRLDASYQIGGLPSGTYTLQITNNVTGSTSTSTVTLDPDGVVQHDVTLGPIN